MKSNIQSKKTSSNLESPKFAFIDILVILCLLICEAGTLGLPLNAYQFIVVTILGIFITKKICLNEKISISIKLLLLIFYMLVITILNKTNADALTGFLFFVIEILAFYFWMSENCDMIKLQRLIYLVAVILSIYGIVQEVAYFLNLRQIYDLSLYGFPSRPDEIRNGFLSVSSLYSEPSHCVNFISWGLWIGLTQNGKAHYVSLPKNIIILLCAFFTQSAIVYIACIIVFAAFLFVYKKGFKKKLQYGLIILVGSFAVFLLFADTVLAVLSRLKQFENISTDTSQDLSALSLVSNLLVAIEKMKDGFWLGTGFDSHRLYYYHYIEELYGELYMYLNIDDAGSMFTRVLSEFGIVGFAFFILAAIKKCVSAIKNDRMDQFSFLLIFLLIIMRNGQYENVYTIITFLGAFVFDAKRSVKT